MFERTPGGETIRRRETVNSQQVSLFSTNTLLRSQKKNAEKENRQDKGELVWGDLGFYSITAKEALGDQFLSVSLGGAEAALGSGPAQRACLQALWGSA